MRKLASVSVLFLALASPAAAQSARVQAGDTPAAPWRPVESSTAALQPFPARADARDAASVRMAETVRASVPGRYATWGAVVGGVAGLGYGLVAGNDAFDLSPVIETAVGIGVGFYIGMAADVIHAMRGS